MTDFLWKPELEAFERKTRELFCAYLNKNQISPHNGLEFVAVYSVFKSDFAYSLPAESIIRRAKHGTHGAWLYNADEKIQAALTKLARAKVLRSRQDGGRRFYEVNY